MKKLSDKLSEEKVKELEGEGRVKFTSWGDDERFFVVVDGRDVYWHTGEETNKYYYIAKRDPKKDIFWDRTTYLP